MTGWRCRMEEETAKTRCQVQEAMVRLQPGDTFARYGLAMELANTEPEAAWTHFTFLLENHPDYAANYYQAGGFLSRQGRLEEARKVLSTGLEVTARQGNRHAQSELQA